MKCLDSTRCKYGGIVLPHKLFACQMFGLLVSLFCSVAIGMMVEIGTCDWEQLARGVGLK